MLGAHTAACATSGPWTLVGRRAPIPHWNMAQRDLETLSPDECLEMLGRAHVGRLVYVDDVGPIAVPVNYALADGDIVIRVEGGTKRVATGQPVLAFEVDHVDEDEHSGWSVIARGPGREVPIDEVPALLNHMKGRFPEPWALGVHNVWLRVTPQALTGRRLGAQVMAPIF